MKAISEMCPAL